MGTSAAKSLVDPRDGLVYTVVDGGQVEVLDPVSGATGRFIETGEWRSGTLKYADRQLLGWMGRLSVRMASGPVEEPAPDARPGSGL